jgi:ornithine decarboxylase
MTERISRYLREQQPETPCLVIDLDVVEHNFRRMRELLPAAHIFYAVKANPARRSCPPGRARLEVRHRLARRDRAGAGRPAWLRPHLLRQHHQEGKGHRLGLPAGRAPVRLRQRGRAAEAGPRRAGRQVFCRVLVDCGGAEWPLSKKFGCAPEMAKDLLRKAKDWGLDAYGISFHVGSQQTDLEQWDKALGQVSQMFFALAEEGVDLRMVNLGGGFPARYRAEVNGIEAYCEAVDPRAGAPLRQPHAEVIIEPGRSMVGDAGVIQCEVVLVSRKAATTASAGSTSTSASSRAWPRPWTRASSTACARAATARASAGRAGRPDLRLGRHPVREDRVQAAAVAEARRQGRDPVDRRLHDDLLVGARSTASRR